MISDNSAISAAQIVARTSRSPSPWPTGRRAISTASLAGFLPATRIAKGGGTIGRGRPLAVVPDAYHGLSHLPAEVRSDIIEQIFKDLGFSDYELQVKGSHPQRDYCVQYRETDFNFVSRLMEEEGIFYFFKHQDSKHMLVLADQKGACVDCQESEVEYPREAGTRAIKDHITHWEHHYEFRTGKWSQTDYNFEDHPARGEPTPAQLMMASQTTTVKLDNLDKFEFYDYPGATRRRTKATPTPRFGWRR